MQSMLEGYLAFARGEAAEDTGSFDLAAFFDKLEEEAELRGRKHRRPRSAGDAEVQVRPHAFARLLSNVVGNAFRYAKNVGVKATHTRGRLTVIVDDDGPGIPAERREDVFRPFFRLDAARNQDDRRHRPRPVDRPRHRPQPRRRHHARRQPDGRPAGDHQGAGMRGCRRYRLGVCAIALAVARRRRPTRLRSCLQVGGADGHQLRRGLGQARAGRARRPVRQLDRDGRRPCRRGAG